jgi:histidinol-phosphate aminotransferase
MNPVNILNPREAVRRIDPYVPPTGERSGGLRLDFNENTVGCSPLVLESLRAALDASTLSMYPAYGEARQELARFFCVPPGELLLTNGTDEAIQVVVNTYVADRDEVVLLRPSYAMYRFYCQAAGAAVREVAYRLPDLAFPLEELLWTIGPSTRAVLIANPNNPTGTGLELDGIEELLKAAAHAAVLIDEAYFEFCDVTTLPLLSRFPNLFVSRTFSKAYGLAALRIGCLFSRPENIACLQRVQSPYSVNALAAMAACAACEPLPAGAVYGAEPPGACRNPAPIFLSGTLRSSDCRRGCRQSQAGARRPIADCRASSGLATLVCRRYGG